MIIYIDKSVGDHGRKEGLSEDEKLLFTELVIGHQRGNCLLCGDLTSIEWLMRSLGGVQGSLYRKVHSKHAETRAILDSVETLLVISFDEQPNIPAFIKDKARLFTVPQAINYHLNEKSILLGENLNDCKFYELLAERYLYSYPKKIKGTSLSFHHEPGGGVLTNTVFEKCVEVDKRLTLCLVDSDIKHGPTAKYPNEPSRGDTVHRLIDSETALRKRVNAQIFELYCLPVHEVENLIPISVLNDIANSTVRDMIPGVSYLEKLFNAGLDQAILFYDFKNGGNKVKTDQSITYWIEIAEMINDDSFPYLSSKVLEKAITHLSTMLPSGNKRVVSVSIENYLTPLWREIGLKVFSWGCANRPERS